MSGPALTPAYRFRRVGTGFPTAYLIHTPADAIGVVESINRTGRGPWRAWPLGRGGRQRALAIQPHECERAGVAYAGTHRFGAAVFRWRGDAARAVEAIGLQSGTGSGRVGE